MKVVCLLNSGADVQTENKVYIFFTCPYLYNMGPFLTLGAHAQ